MTTNSLAAVQFEDMSITLLWRCNYRCPSCLVGDKLTSKEALTFEDAKRIIDSAAKLRTIRSIAFVGGEPFLVHDLMVKISEYVRRKFGRLSLSASTNSYWAKNIEVARRKIEPLARFGLDSILLSWDDFHANFGKIDQVANAITVCNEFGIEVTVQNIYVRNSNRIATFKAILDEMCDTKNVDWGESPCTPVGLGAKIDSSAHDYIDINDLEFGDCSAGEILNIEADGSVKPCCGAGVMSEGLTMGNIHQKSIDRVVGETSVDPIFNSLIAFKGPKHLVKTLQKAGRNDLIPNKITEACDACFRITNNPEAVEVIRENLSKDHRVLSINRAASEYCASVEVIRYAENAEKTIFDRIPNIRQASRVEALDSSSLTPADFQKDFLCRHEPLLIQNSSGLDPEFFQNWNDLRYLVNKVGDELVDVTFGMTKNKRKTNVIPMTLEKYVEIISKKSYSSQGIGTYMEEHAVPKGLKKDTSKLQSQLFSLAGYEPNWKTNELILGRGLDDPAFNMFFGRYTFTDCHEHGGYEAFLIQTSGEKEVLLYKPSHENANALGLSEHQRSNWSNIKMYDPDIETYPHFRESQPTYITVKSGEILYIPDGWYHAVSSIGHEIATSLTLFLPMAFYDFSAAPRQLDLKRMQRDNFSFIDSLLENNPIVPLTKNAYIQSQKSDFKGSFSQLESSSVST